MYLAMTGPANFRLKEVSEVVEPDRHESDAPTPQ